MNDVPGEVPHYARWWQPPRLHDEEERHEHRKVTWIELFYDLVFVVAVAQISHQFSEHVSWAGAGQFVLLFVAVWWTWVSGTVYNDRFESRGLENRLFAFLQMVAVGCIALFAHDGTGHNATGFALSFVGANAIVQVFWIRGGIHNPPFRPVLWRYMAGFYPSLALWLVSIWVDAPAKFALWMAGLAGLFITPMFTLKLQERLPRFSTSKMPERYGLFVIIVLGEGIVGAISGMARHEHLDHHHAVVGLLAIALPFALWWTYFDFVARRVPLPGRWNVFFWGALGHMPLVLGLAATGAGVLNMVALSSVEALPHEVQALLGCAVGFSLGSVGLIETRLARPPHEPTHPVLSPALKLVCGAAIAALGLAMPPTHTYWFALPILALLAVNPCYAAWVWFRNPKAHGQTHYQG